MLNSATLFSNLDTFILTLFNSFVLFSVNNSKVSNPSQFNKYFAGNSIDTYNEALSYAEGMMNSGKVNGYALNPDGNGFNVVFS